MTFKSNLANLHKEIHSYEVLSENTSIVENYSRIATRLDKVSHVLTEQVNKNNLIKQLENYGGKTLDKNTPVFDNIENLFELLSLYKNSWIKLQDKSLQDPENSLFMLEDGVRSKTKELNTFHHESWDEWVQMKRKEFVVPDLILENQLTVYKNKELYNNYKINLNEFDSNLESFNFKQDELLKINRLIDTLVTLQSEMKKDNLPISVQNFFNSVNNYKFSRPTLDLLTEEVFVWLKENDMLKQFVVTPNV
ncbi:hypothetical protein HYO14_05220 [Vibrio parahaemolyticus]|nr:hypothetical protein [Vibrio parahaemolyticus]MBM5002118.1 hypothetical protein [Vibrio parahaemolyticus]